MGELEQVLLEAAGPLGIEIGPRELACFRRYYELLAARADKRDLTAARGEREVAARHLADSLAGLLVLTAARLRLLDVGAGAGFPGLVLKIMRPAWQVVLLEASRKKCAFLREAVAVLGLEGVEVVWGRAEELGHAAGHRESYGAVVARAVAGLRVLLEYGLPLVEKGGLFVAYKGQKVEEELRRAERALAVLGGEVAEVRKYRLGSGGEGVLVVVRKIGETPAGYPRREGVPARRPL